VSCDQHILSANAGERVQAAIGFRKLISGPIAFMASGGRPRA